MGMNLNRENKKAKTVTISLNPAEYEELLKATGRHDQSLPGVYCSNTSAFAS